MLQDNSELSGPPQSEHGEKLVQTLCHGSRLDDALHGLARLSSPPSSYTYLSLLKACIQQKSLFQARLLYTHLAYYQVLNSLVAGYLVVTLAKCGAIEDALYLSHSLPHRTVFTWSAIISAYADCGRGSEALELYSRMQEDGVEANAFTYVSLFKACGRIPDLIEGKRLHEDARRTGLVSHSFVANTIVSMYGKCGALAEAQEVFSILARRTLVSWNAMISAYVEQEEAPAALQSYRQMQEEGVGADQTTFVITLQACGILAEKNDFAIPKGRSARVMALEIGQALHKDVRDRGYGLDTLVGNTLITMYGKCGTIVQAEGVFSTLSRQSVVSWNAMLSQYIKHGQAEKALLLYSKMREDGKSPNHLTLVSTLQACGMAAEREDFSKAKFLEIGGALQIDAQRTGCLLDPLVRNTLLSMYGKCGSILDVEQLFISFLQRDIVSWNAMLSAYIEQEREDKALWLYEQMLDESVGLDAVTLSCVLLACSALGSPHISQEVHFVVVSSGYGHVNSVTSPLLNAYANCSSIEDAMAIWNEVVNPSIILWTACIAGHAQEGNASASLHLYDEMRQVGIKLDELAYTTVLSACTRTGLVVEGLELFESVMWEDNLTQDSKHLDSLVDLLARAGDLKKVESLLRRMSTHAGLTSWLHLLGACRMHGNVELAKHAFQSAVTMQPGNFVPYVLMSMVYAEGGEGGMAESSKLANYGHQDE